MHVPLVITGQGDYRREWPPKAEVDLERIEAVAAGACQHLLTVEGSQLQPAEVRPYWTQVLHNVLKEHERVHESK